jgi:hypothetical protein
MNEKLIKPVSVARQEFIEQLVNNINNCQLPMFVIEPILQDMLNMVRAAAQKQYEAEKAQYEAQLNVQKEQNK